VLNKFNKLAERQQKAWVSDSPARVEPQPKVIKVRLLKPNLCYDMELLFSKPVTVLGWAEQLDI